MGRAVIAKNSGLSLAETAQLQDMIQLPSNHHTIYGCYGGAEGCALKNDDCHDPDSLLF